MKQRITDFERQRRIDFGLYLKELRERPGKKKTQTEVEDHLDIKQGCLSLIESGDRLVSDGLLVELANEYDVPPEAVLRERYWPQLFLLSFVAIIDPKQLSRELIEELEKGFEEAEQRDFTRYIAVLLHRRDMAKQH